MSADAKASSIESFKSTIETKIRTLIVEFSEGRISREQFHVIYERYSNQLNIVNEALQTGNDEMAAFARVGPSTVAVRDAYMGKARGMLVYHNKSATTVETLGDFDVPVGQISKALNDYTLQMEEGKLIDRRTEKLENRRWLLYSAGKHTTVVVLFQNEPSPIQSREIERLLHDFEQANASFLTKDHVESDKLAYPFMVFIKQKMHR